MTKDGQGQGHYICDVRQTRTNTCYKTNDNNIPIPIIEETVTKHAVVVLYKKIINQ